MSDKTAGVWPQCWQPIESMPKEVENALFTGGVINNICSGSDEWYEVGDEIYQATKYGHNDYFSVDDYCKMKPTHWRPNPPKLNSKEDRMARFLGVVCREFDEGHKIGFQPVLYNFDNEDGDEYVAPIIKALGTNYKKYNSLPIFLTVRACKQFIKDYHQELLWYFGINDSVEGE